MLFESEYKLVNKIKLSWNWKNTYFVTVTSKKGTDNLNFMSLWYEILKVSENVIREN